MVAFLHWSRSILFGTLNGLVKLALAVVLILVVLLLIGLVRGDGLPGNMVLTLDLRNAIADSAPPAPFGLGGAPTVMDVEMALDEAGRDARVKGMVMQLGDGAVSTAEAEELGAAIARFRAKGKFVMAYSHGFLSTGLGDYLLAASANEIWMQPHSVFSPAGAGVGEVFLRGLLDKIQATPQIVKRAEYKSAADTFMEKTMTDADRQQLTALLQSVYQSATAGAASARKLPIQLIVSSLDKSPQFAEQAQKEGLIDKLAYDDDADYAALKQAGHGARKVPLAEFLHAKSESGTFANGPKVALIQASGDIVDGSVSGNGLFGGRNVIASDDMAKTIRQATADNDVKAIVLRVDSPGGSVSASDQILDALKKAQKKGKPVVVSMGGVAASGGYFISAYANRIVAQPATITGSIGVLTGKVAFGKTLGLIGVSGEQIGIGKNALIDSPLQPFTPDQLANLNAQADATYADFKQKVSAGRKLPLTKVDEIAKGRVWSGADAKAQGLVDQLGGVWDAGEAARKLAHMSTKQPLIFKRYPRAKGLFETLGELFGNTAAGARAVAGLARLMDLPPIRATLDAMAALPKGDVQMRAANLPQP